MANVVILLVFIIHMTQRIAPAIISFVLLGNNRDSLRFFRVDVSSRTSVKIRLYWRYPLPETNSSEIPQMVFESLAVQFIVRLSYFPGLEIDQCRIFSCHGIKTTLNRVLAFAYAPVESYTVEPMRHIRLGDAASLSSLSKFTIQVEYHLVNMVCIGKSILTPFFRFYASFHS